MSHDLHTADSRISAFLEAAETAAIPQASQVGMLAARGWREKDIYLAFGDRYRALIGLEVPRRTGSGASAKDAFFYLLIFSTLATWTLSLGTLAFELIDPWLADPLFSPFGQQLETYEIAWSLAAMIVAFPLYLLLSRAVLRDAAADPEKLDSGIRKWLTYPALVVAASIFMGDLICALAFLLRGELTSRFLFKAFVVLALSGGVFYYYFGGLRAPQHRDPDTRTTLFHRDRAMALISSAAVALMLVLGFLQLGPPRSQRDLRADARRIHDLYGMGSSISNYWREHAHQLPATISQLPGAPPTDPITHAPYEYHPSSGADFNLCATFNRESPATDPSLDQWTHPAGHRCFALSATTRPQYPTEPIE